MSGDILWTPSRERKQSTALWQFAEETRHLHGAGPDDYPALHGWSVREPENFHSILWDFLDIIGEKGERSFIAGKTIQDAKFYPDARLNYAENLLRYRDDKPAIIAHRDDGTRRTITRRELYDQVSQLVQAFQGLGVTEGDRVAAIVTHDIEAIVGYLATSAIGAIWSSCSPDFGPAGASDRLCQINPKVLLAVPGYGYAGKQIDVSSTIRAISDGAELAKIILISDFIPDTLSDLDCITLDTFIRPFRAADIPFNRLPFDAPLAILFSSGTTGKPKCITHSGAGLLIQHKKEHVLHCDLREGEHFFYFTTCGWMMWNWQVSGLATGATLITYDGNPFHPRPEQLIDLIDAENIAVFGTSAKYIDTSLKAGLKPRQSHDLGSLRLILSTGSPLISTGFDYIYQDWKTDVHLASVSGGTDICACFLGGIPTLPVWRGELQGALLGLDVDTLDEEGHSLTDLPGEFVCRNAHVSMPVKFWNDKDGSQYHNSYFTKFPGIWAHGDYAEKRPSGGYIIHGRSDTTLNPGGIRIGTAEIYSQVEVIPEIAESIVVGQMMETDQRVILFVRMREGAKLDEEMIKLIRHKIRTGASPRHMPAKIIAVDDIPRTRSGKISEIAVRDTIHGQVVKNQGALANPEALELYKDLPELRE